MVNPMSLELDPKEGGLQLTTSTAAGARQHQHCPIPTNNNNKFKANKAIKMMHNEKQQNKQ